MVASVFDYAACITLLLNKGSKKMNWFIYNYLYDEKCIQRL